MKKFWKKFGLKIKGILVIIGLGLSYIFFRMWTNKKKADAGVADDIEVELHPTATVTKKVDLRKKETK